MSKENIFKKVQNILMQYWDPIGIKEFPNAFDEYDIYAKKISEMIINDCSETELCNYLILIQSEHMGLSINDSNIRDVSTMLNSLKKIND